MTSKGDSCRRSRVSDRRATQRVCLERADFTPAVVTTINQRRRIAGSTRFAPTTPRCSTGTCRMAFAEWARSDGFPGPNPAWRPCCLAEPAVDLRLPGRESLPIIFGRFEIDPRAVPANLAAQVGKLEPHYYGQAIADPGGFTAKVNRAARSRGSWVTWRHAPYKFTAWYSRAANRVQIYHLSG